MDKKIKTYNPVNNTNIFCLFTLIMSLISIFGISFIFDHNQILYCLDMILFEICALSGFMFSITLSDSTWYKSDKR